MIGAIVAQISEDSSGWVAAIAACALVLFAIGGAYTKLKLDINSLQVKFDEGDKRMESIDREQAWQVRALYRIMYKIGVKPPNGFDGHHYEGNGGENDG